MTPFGCARLSRDGSIKLFLCSCGQTVVAMREKCDAVVVEKLVPAGRCGFLD